MAINNGLIEATVDNVVLRCYYDHTAPLGAQPLINGPRGFCLDLTNPTGRTTRVAVRLPGGTTTTIAIGSGDPVTGGPPSGRSRTAAQMASLGFLTRDDVSSVSFGV